MPINATANTAIAATVIFQFLINTLRIQRSMSRSEIIIVMTPARDCDAKSIIISEMASNA